MAATLTTYADQMRHNPLESNHLRTRTKPLLLIFDGLDELTASVEVGEAISAAFLRELNTSLRLWGDHPIWTIVTGRDAIFGHAEGPTMALPGELFHLLPYYVSGLEGHTPNRDHYHDPNSLLEVDNRKLFFSKFSSAKGRPTNDLPSSYDDADLLDVTSQPLLNYFFLTSEPGDFVDGNIARIYSRLFDRLHARSRNISNRRADAGKPGAELSQNQFDRVFEAMAVAAWRTGGTRAASWMEVLTEVKREDTYLRRGAPTLLDIFESHMTERSAQKPFRLAAAFFMRNDKASGVEFTHRSFGDYLYARRLVKAISTMARELMRDVAMGKEMLNRWAALTADQQISPEVSRFLQLEIRATIDEQERDQWHCILNPTVEKLFRDGWQEPNELTMRQAERRTSQMEEALFVAWKALWCPTREQPNWTLGEEAENLIVRGLLRQASAQGGYGNSVMRRCLSQANLRDARLVGTDLCDADLDDVNLEGSFLDRVNFGQARLWDAKLCYAFIVESVFNEAWLPRADFTGATVLNSLFVNTRLINAKFNKSCLRGANFEGAQLGSADFRESVLENAIFRGANLEGANFKGAKLKGANLEGANLKGANLQDASLEDTKVQVR